MTKDAEAQADFDKAKQLGFQRAALVTPTPTPTPMPTPKMSDDQIRAENDKVFQRLRQEKINVEQSATPAPKMSDDQIRAENDKVFQRLQQQKINAGQ